MGVHIVMHPVCVCLCGVRVSVCSVVCVCLCVCLCIPCRSMARCTVSSGNPWLVISSYKVALLPSKHDCKQTNKQTNITAPGISLC